MGIMSEEKVSSKLFKKGIFIFGGSGSSLRKFDNTNKPPLIIADLSDHYDGGCGAEKIDDEGYLRGEGHGR